jgi:hypothetical protein
VRAGSGAQGLGGAQTAIDAPKACLEELKQQLPAWIDRCHGGRRLRNPN